MLRSSSGSSASVKSTASHSFAVFAGDEKRNHYNCKFNNASSEDDLTSDCFPWDWYEEVVALEAKTNCAILKQLRLNAIHVLRPSHTSSSCYSLLAGRNTLLAIVLEQPTAWLCFEALVRLNQTVGGHPLAAKIFALDRLEAKLGPFSAEQKMYAIALRRCARCLEKLAMGEFSGCALVSFLRSIPPSLRYSLPVAHILALAAVDFPALIPRATALVRALFGNAPPLPLLPALAIYSKCSPSTALQRLNRHPFPEFCPEIWPFLAIAAKHATHKESFVEETLRSAQSGRCDLAIWALRGVPSVSCGLRERLFTAAMRQPTPPPCLARYRAALWELQEMNATKAMETLLPTVASNHPNAAVLSGVLCSSAAAGGQSPLSDAALAAQRRALRGSRLLAQAARLTADPVPLYLWALAHHFAGRNRAAEQLLNYAIERQPLQLEFRWLRARARASQRNFFGARCDLRVVAALLRAGGRAADAASTDSTDQQPALLPLRLALQQKSIAVGNMDAADLLAARTPENSEDEGATYHRPCNNRGLITNAPLLKREESDPWVTLLRGESAQALKAAESPMRGSANFRTLLTSHASRYSRRPGSPAADTANESSPRRFMPLGASQVQGGAPVTIPGLAELLGGAGTRPPLQEWLLAEDSSNNNTPSVTPLTPQG